MDSEVRRAQAKVQEAEELIKRRTHGDQMRARELEQKRIHEREQRERLPPVKIVDVRSVSARDFGVPDLEEEDIPELEDVDDDTDIDGPPPPVTCLP